MNKIEKVEIRATRELLNKLKEPYKSQALYNLDNFGIKYGYRPTKIQTAVRLINTVNNPQGCEYWEAVALHYQKGSALPPPAKSDEKIVNYVKQARNRKIMIEPIEEEPKISYSPISFKIEKGIPFPQNKKKELISLLTQMEPGDSIFIPYGGEFTKTDAQLCISAARHRVLSKNIKLRQLSSVNGTRVWAMYSNQ